LLHLSVYCPLSLLVQATQPVKHQLQFSLQVLRKLINPNESNQSASVRMFFFPFLNLGIMLPTLGGGKALKHHTNV